MTSEICICKPNQENVNQTDFYLSTNFRNIQSMCVDISTLTYFNNSGGVKRGFVFIFANLLKRDRALSS